jgi:serine/threonine protein kinase
MGIPSTLRLAFSERYRMDDVLGAGGMATVYLAHDLKHDRDVALKVLRPEIAASLGTDRFLAEIRLTARLQYPHIVPLFDSGEIDGFLFYVMPYLEGESLRNRMEREQRLDVETTVAICGPVAEALAYAHDLGIVHRDIKPENILLCRGQPFVTDFGIARAVSVASGERLTLTGMSIGTPAYMSPEQAVGQEALDGRSDVYSLGCVIFEMLTGTPPFAGSTAQALIAQRLSGPPPHLTTVPAPVGEVVRRSLASAPQDRFQTASALAEALVEAATRPAMPELSLVVLPFENLSPDPDNAYFADGLTEELIADLSKIKTLRVISRTSAMHYKGATKPIPTIARELNVRFALEGSVRRAGDNLRITAQLIDALSDTHLWAEKYLGELKDVFQLQEDLSRRIAGALKGALTPEDKRRLAQRATHDPRVYEIWLRARQDSYQATRESIERGIRLTEQGLQSFGEHALLYAAQAIALYFAYDFGFSHDEVTLGRCEAAACRALELNPDLPEALYAKGLTRYKRGDMPDFVVYLRRAVELERTSDALGWLGFVLAEAGLMAEARAHAKESVERDPLAVLPAFSRAIVDLFDGHFDVAADKICELIAGGSMDPAFLHWWLGQALAYAGREDEAIAAFGMGARTTAGLMADMCELGVRAHSGDRQTTCEWFESNADVQRGAQSDETFPRFVSECFARVGEWDAALEWMERAIDWGFTNHGFLVHNDRFYVDLRDNARFLTLLERAGEKQRQLGVPQ